MQNKFIIKTTKPKITIATTKATKLDVVVNKPIINAKRSKAFFQLKNTGGPIGAKGDKGDPGQAATITAGTATSLPAGSTPTVANSGTSTNAVFDFGIPKGDKGDTGATGATGQAATISVGSTTTGAPGTNASVTNVGTSSAAVLNFTVPRGATGATGAPGTPGTPGAPGQAATIAVGATSTLPAGSSATVTNSGTSSAAVFNFGVPKGDKGDTGASGSAATVAVGTVTTGTPNTPASVTNVGTSSAAVFDFVIPKGDKGDSGSGTGDMLASNYDPNGTVQSDGGIEAYVATVLPTKTSDLINDGADNTSTYLEADETAYRASGIPYGAVDNTSTSTAFTATVPGITSLYDGVCMWLKNGVITSAAGFTININGLGAKPVYSNMAAATTESTLFNANYTFFFVYDSTRVAGGCWVLDRGYNSNDNTIGYQVRTNSQSLPASDAFVRYRLLFTSADGTKYVPATTSTSTNATANRTVNQKKINPFGRIFYYSSTTAIAQNDRPGVSSIWEQYVLGLGYSFAKGAALTMTSWKPVYLKCAPQTDGSAIIDSTTPWVQDLPTTEDGKIYIFLGIAYSATNIELQLDHPVYYYKGGMIRPWTNQVTQANSDWNANSGVAEILNKPTIPTKTSDLNNDSGFLTSSNAVTSFNGSTGAVTYTAPVTSVNGATGAVTISVPTVNDATLTIKKNGTNVATFTANASSNATADISVPTNTSDLNNDSGFMTSPIQTNDIQNGAVTSAKIDWTTLPSGTISSRTYASGGTDVIVNSIPTQANTDYYVIVEMTDGGSAWTNLTWRTKTKTATSFTLNVYNTANYTTGNITLRWIIIPQ